MGAQFVIWALVILAVVIVGAAILYWVWDDDEDSADATFSAARYSSLIEPLGE